MEEYSCQNQEGEASGAVEDDRPRDLLLEGMGGNIFPQHLFPD